MWSTLQNMGGFRIRESGFSHPGNRTWPRHSHMKAGALRCGLSSPLHAQITCKHWRFSSSTLGLIPHLDPQASPSSDPSAKSALKTPRPQQHHLPWPTLTQKLHFYGVICLITFLNEYVYSEDRHINHISWNPSKSMTKPVFLKVSCCSF